MGGYGNIQPLLRNNKNLLRKSTWLKKKRSFSERKKELQKLYEGEIEFKDISSIDLNKLKRKIRLKHKKQEKRNNIISAFIFLFIVVFMAALFLYFKNIQTEVNQFNQVKIDKEYKAKYLPKFTFCLDDGDKWLAEKHYKNAIYQYKKALEYFPNDLLAKTKLEYAYKERCKKLNIDCDKLKK